MSNNLAEHLVWREMQQGSWGSQKSYITPCVSLALLTPSLSLLNFPLSQEQLNSLCLAWICEAPFFEALAPVCMCSSQGLTYPKMVAQSFPYQQWSFLWKNPLTSHSNRKKNLSSHYKWMYQLARDAWFNKVPEDVVHVLNAQTLWKREVPEPAGSLLSQTLDVLHQPQWRTAHWWDKL